MNSQPLPTNQTDLNSHRILLPLGAPVPQTTPPSPGSRFRFPATLRGSTPHFEVYYNPELDSTGQNIADGILETCERDYQTISGYFGDITPPGLPCSVIITLGIYGASHPDCSSTDIYCEAKTYPTVDIDFTRFGLAAELVEVFSSAQGRGWNCEASNGEGLSRVLAPQLYPAQLGNFSTAAQWLNTPGRPDFVNTTDPTDRNPISVGCAVLFLNYLHYQLNFSWYEIVQAGASTLGQTYINLSEKSANLVAPNDALQPFKSLLQTHFPEGELTDLKTDNPFPLST